MKFTEQVIKLAAKNSYTQLQQNKPSNGFVYAERRLTDDEKQTAKKKTRAVK